jgi:carboxymethylenebutenolidase
MCFGDDARPPDPPLPGIVGDHGEVLLRSADGTQFNAYYAYPTARVRSAVVVMPDVRGLHPFYQELAQRFAQAHLLAIAIDYFGRTAPFASTRDNGFPYREHADQMRPEYVAADVASAVGWLRGNADHNVTSVFTVGFCRGGSLSWAQSAEGHGLAGCVGFYGTPSSVADRIPDFADPLLILAAGQDQTPVDEVEQFAERVRAQGVEAEMHVYPDAPHSFFDRTSGEYQQECDDAWRHILAFVESHAT